MVFSDFAWILLLLWQGLGLGLLLFLLGSGFTLIYSMMGVLNFAHASLYMLGAYAAYGLSLYVGFWWALVLAPLLVAALGGLLEWVLLAPVHGRGHMAELLLTFGLSLLVLEGLQWFFGRSALQLPVPPELQAPWWQVAGVAVSGLRVLLVLVSLAVLVLMCLLLYRSSLGLLLRAALTEPQMLAALGYRVSPLYIGVFACGAGLAGLAGVLGGALAVVEPGMAAAVGPILFVIVVLGGLGSLRGALLVALALGLLQSVAVWASGAWAWVAQGAAVWPYLLLVLVLCVRPRGLWGQRDV